MQFFREKGVKENRHILNRQATLSRENGPKLV